MKPADLKPTNADALVDTSAAYHGLKAQRDADLKAKRKLRADHEDEAQQLAQAEAAIQGEPKQPAYDHAEPILSLSLANDTGESNSDGITRDGTVNVSGLEPGATWKYSTDGGANWTAGTGTSFTLAAGTYAQGMVQVRQIDAAGNISGRTRHLRSLRGQSHRFW